MFHKILKYVFQTNPRRIFSFILEGKNLLRKILHLLYFGYKNNNFFSPPLKHNPEYILIQNPRNLTEKMLLQFLGEEGMIVSLAFVLCREGVKRKISPNSDNLVKSYFRKKCDLTKIVANS